MNGFCTCLNISVLITRDVRPGILYQSSVTPSILVLQLSFHGLSGEFNGDAADRKTYAFELLAKNDLAGLVFQCDTAVDRVGQCSCAYPSSSLASACQVSGEDVLEVSLRMM